MDHLHQRDIYHLAVLVGDIHRHHHHYHHLHHLVNATHQEVLTREEIDTMIVMMTDILEADTAVTIVTMTAFDDLVVVILTMIATMTGKN